MVKKRVRSGSLRPGGMGKSVMVVNCKQDDYAGKDKYYTEKGKMNKKTEGKKKIKEKMKKVLKSSSSSSFVLERCSNLNNKKNKLKRKKSGIFMTKEGEDKLLLSCEVEEKADEPLLTSRSSRRRKQRKQQKQQHQPQEEEEELTNIIPVKEGDRINVTKLLFSKHRSFLLKSNSKQLVRAEDLVGKTIVIFFANLRNDACLKPSFTLIDVYNQLHHKKYPFEVVLVPFTRPFDNNEFPRDDPHHSFTSIFSSMPWTAVPYSDVTSCQRIITTFGWCRKYSPEPPIIDPTGLVLNLFASSLLRSFGSLAYPFTKQRINFLVSEANATLNNASIWNLLASPERDYVISNNGREVPILSLEDKVVALHFFDEDHSPFYPDLTAELITAYEQLVKTNNFEVVLIYVHDRSCPLRRTKENTFWKLFKTMPWLALPFKDPVISKLRRICQYPLDLVGPAPDPRLVIVGPRGGYFEPYGVDIFMNFGVPAYPFTRRKVVDLVAGKAKSVKLDMLWDSHTVLRRRDKSEVKFSEVAGKRIILLIGINWVRAFAEALSILKSKYDLMKGRDDEFEVIQIFNLRELSDYSEHAADVPWLVHPFDEDSPGLSLLLGASGDARLLAFNRHGQVVRRATWPHFEVREDSTFPFNAAGDLEKEVYNELYNRFSWIYWRKNSIFDI